MEHKAIRELYPDVHSIVDGADGRICTDVDGKVVEIAAADVAVKLAELNTNFNAQKIQQNRRQAYLAEADTLYFEEQADEVAAGTWAAKRAEIKARYPK